MLPIDQALPALRDALRSHAAAVLVAPPGAGKTTRVPLALLHEPWLAGQRIVMLEPRRLAARAAARFMARTLGEPVGVTVGYRMRMDTRVGPSTRIEVVTEGVLTRLLQSDPTLEGTGLVIFDEYHERSLHADLGLGLVLQTRELLRDDLRLLVMSATLDGAAVASLIGDTTVIASEGRAFPVETRYAERRPEPRALEGAVARAVGRALASDDGDLLVFLPGGVEIRRVGALLAGSGLPASVRVAPLYGNLPQEAQDLAIAPSAEGVRRIVLATSIAETSLTIDGVRVVIDSGLSRVPRFSARSGMTRLETVRVSRASADQRRGRAGRLTAGVCYRLWPEHEQPGLLPRSTPEILEADLAPLALELAAAGIADPTELRWLDPPPAAAYAQARELLVELGALGGPRSVLPGLITPHGRRMSALALHPRLAHMMLAADGLGLAAIACDLAALLGERDLLRGDDGPPDADLRLRLDLVRGEDDRVGAPGLRVDRDTLRRVRADARHWRERLGVARAVGGEDDTEAAGLLLAFAYPDRIAQRRDAGGGRLLLRNGTGALLAGAQALADAPYLVVAETDGRLPESRIYLAAPITREEIEQHFGDQIEVEDAVEWDDDAQAVRARRRTRLGALVLEESVPREPSADAITHALLAWLARAGIGALPWSEGALRLRERLRFLRHHDQSWPDVSDAALLSTMHAWLAPHLTGMRRRADIARVDLGALLLGRLDWRQRAALDELAPTHVTVPSGSRIPVSYADPQAPVLAVRLQEMFGLRETPAVHGGRVPLTLHLLSPAHRPVQVTRDLAGFWRTTYFDVRKDLRGRYPRHRWPEDPLQAEPSRRVK